MKTPSIANEASPRPSAAMRLLISGSLFVPVVVFPGFFFPYITVRAVFFRVLVELATAILLYLIVRREVLFNFRRDPVLWALTAWVLANALAAAFGAAPMRSIFGDHERMGGVWFWIHLLAYYVVLRTVLLPKDWWRFFQISVGVAALVAAYGLVQYWFQPFNIGVGGIDSGATIGNSGLLAVYLLATIAFCAILAINARGQSRFVYVALSALLVLAMLFSGNRSSTLALFFGAGAAVISFARWSGALRGRRGVTVLAVVASVVALPFVLRTQWALPATSRIPSLSRLGSGIDSTRIIQWRAAAEGIGHRPLLGVGPENYQIVWSQYYDPQMHRFLQESRWDRAHNAYLDAFATAGIMGFLSLLSIWVALFWSVLQSVRRAREGIDGDTGRRVGLIEGVALGFFVAYAFYLIFWFFDLNSTMLWVALAAFMGTRAAGTPLIEIGSRRESRWQAKLVLALGAISLAAVLYVHGYKTLEMARTLDRARNPNRPLYDLLADFESVFGSPAPVTQHAFLMYAGHLRSLYSRFHQIRSDPRLREAFDRAFMLAIREFEQQAVQDPLNERLLIQHGRVLMIGAAYYGNAKLHESALAKLERAVAIAPRRVTSHLVLGWGYLNAQRTQDALAVFRTAYALYPPFPQTRAYLGMAYAALGDPQEAARWLIAAMDVGYLPDRGATLAVGQTLDHRGQSLLAGQLFYRFLRTKYGSVLMWQLGSSELDPGDYDLALIAAELLERGGNPVFAAVIKDAATGLCTGASPLEGLALAALRQSTPPEPPCRQPWRLP